jgi:hypothetical protein
VAASEDDGLVIAGDAVYPPTSPPIAITNDDLLGGVAAATAFNKDNAFIVINGLIRWDTSSLPPDATIQSATFRCKILQAFNDDNDGRSITADWYTDWPIDPSDFSFTPLTTALSGFPLSSVTADSIQDIPLDNVVGVNPHGYTGLRFHITGGQPAGQNGFICASFDNTGGDKPPQLIVTYTVPQPPSTIRSGGAAAPGWTIHIQPSVPTTSAVPLPSPVTPPAPPPLASPSRDLASERLGLGFFVAFFGRLPNTSTDWDRLHALVYDGVPFPRDLSAEKQALAVFIHRFHRKPRSGTDWQRLHALAYPPS